MNYKIKNTKNIHYGDILVKFNEYVDVQNNNVPFINNEKNLSKFKSESYLRDGDIIIADTAEDETVGKVTEISNTNEQKVLSGLHTIPCRPKRKFASMFLGFYMNSESFHKQLIPLITGIKVSSISKTSIATTTISVPLFEEQEKISKFMIAINNMIKEQESSISILETYNKGLISQIFKQEIRFKDDNGNEFPDWEKVKLFDLVEHYGGTALEPLVIENGSCKFISIGNYSPNGKYIDNGQRINPVGKAKDKQLKKDDLVMVLNDKTKNGTIIGSTILIDDDNYIYNQRSERLICKKNVLPYFLWSYINSPLIKNKILQLVQGGTQIYVNFSSVYNMDMHLPIMEEQNKIANFLKQLDKILEQEKVYLEQLKTIKKGLLQQMFI